MVGRANSGTDAGSAAPRAHCRCGHLPTHHMVVLAVGSTGNYRLDRSGPCAICGEATCRKFTLGPRGRMPSYP